MRILFLIGPHLELLVLDKIRLHIAEENIQFSGRTISYTISIGLTTFNTKNNVELDRLFYQSDMALYSAKKSGKNCIANYKAEGDLDIIRSSLHHS